MGLMILIRMDNFDLNVGVSSVKFIQFNGSVGDVLFWVCIFLVGVMRVSVDFELFKRYAWVPRICITWGLQVFNLK
jgi:hypothetical protein